MVESSKSIGLKPPEKCKSPWRWVVLVLACLMLLGSYYCLDIPSALKTQLDDYMGDPNDYEFKFSLLYTLYAAPNVILPFFGGYLVDRFGVRFSLLLFSSTLLLGQVVFSLGVSMKSWLVMFAGRLIFGFGGESFTVANSALLADWFKGKELAFAFGINLSVAKIGSVVNNIISPYLCNSVSIIFAMWMGSILCVFGVFLVLLTMPIDKAFDDKIKNSQEYALLSSDVNPFFEDNEGKPASDLGAALIAQPAVSVPARRRGSTGSGAGTLDSTRRRSLGKRVMSTEKFVVPISSDRNDTSEHDQGTASGECTPMSVGDIGRGTDSVADHNSSLRGSLTPHSTRALSRDASIPDPSQTVPLLKDIYSFTFIFWVIVMSCIVVYGCVLPFNNISSALLLERDYFQAPPSGCELDNIYECQAADNLPNENCPSSQWYQPPLPYNQTVDGTLYPNQLTMSDIDCSDDVWSGSGVCTEEYCRRYDDAVSKTSLVMSIPYVIAAVVSPPLGMFIDKYGQRAIIAAVAPLLLVFVHLGLALTEIDPIGPLVGQGFAYTGFVSVLWPAIPLVVEERLLGLAFGIVTSMMNLGCAVIPLIIATIYSDSGDTYIPNVELLFASLGAVGFLVGLYMNYFDYYHGSVLNRGSSDDDGDDNDDDNDDDNKNDNYNGGGVHVEKGKEHRSSMGSKGSGKGSVKSAISKSTSASRNSGYVGVLDHDKDDDKSHLDENDLFNAVMDRWVESRNNREDARKYQKNSEEEIVKDSVRSSMGDVTELVSGESGSDNSNSNNISNSKSSNSNRSNNNSAVKNKMNSSDSESNGNRNGNSSGQGDRLMGPVDGGSSFIGSESSDSDAGMIWREIKGVDE